MVSCRRLAVIGCRGQPLWSPPKRLVSDGTDFPRLPPINFNGGTTSIPSFSAGMTCEIGDGLCCLRDTQRFALSIVCSCNGSITPKRRGMGERALMKVIVFMYDFLAYVCYGKRFSVLCFPSDQTKHSFCIQFQIHLISRTPSQTNGSTKGSGR